MPKQVDHDERRRVLAQTAAGIVAARGLDALTFRELAGEAGVSVASVQHYFGSKADLLVHTLDRQSDEIGARVAARLDALGPDARPGARILTVAQAFLPTDDLSRQAMVVYLSFAAGALTDAFLNSAGAFARGEELRAYIAAQLSAAAPRAHAVGRRDQGGDHGPGAHPRHVPHRAAPGQPAGRPRGPRSSSSRSPRPAP